MKRFLQIFSLLLFASMAYSQSQKLVFVEEFTQASCPPCEATTPSLNAAVAANVDKVVQLRYQVSWPGFDPMHLDNEQEVNDRVSYYNVGGVPALFLDGTVEEGNDQTVLPQTSIDSKYALQTPIKIEVSHTISSDLTSTDITVKITNEGSSAYNVSTNRLRVVIIEEDITYPYPPGSTSLKVFDAVMKKFVTGTAGLQLPSIAAGETWEKTWTAESLPSAIYDYNKIGVVAFIQNDNNKSIVNVNLSESQDLAVYPDLIATDNNVITSEYCDYSFTPKVSIKNNGNVTIDEYNLIFYINEAIVSTTNYKTPLEAGSTVDISLDEMTLPAGNSIVNYIVNPVSAVDLSILNNFTAPFAIGKIGGVIEEYVNKFEDTEVATLPANSIVTAPSNVDFNFNVVNKEFFQSSQKVGGKGLSEKSLFVNFYYWDPSTTDPNASFIISDQYLVNSGDKLNFDWAFTTYPTESGSTNDRLQIQISKDCGVTFEDLFNKSGTNLRTAPETSNNGIFIPKAAQWKSSEHDLTSYAGETVILRAYVTSDYGNLMFIDNINIVSGPSDVNDLVAGESLTVYPNPATATTNFEFNLTSPSEVSYSVTDALGKMVENKNLGNTSGKFNHTFDVSDYKSGLYFVNFQLGERQVLKRLMVIH